jgi:hypothetical protein
MTSKQEVINFLLKWGILLTLHAEVVGIPWLRTVHFMPSQPHNQLRKTRSITATDALWREIEAIAQRRTASEPHKVSRARVVEEALEEHVRAWNAAHGKATLKRITDIHGGKHGKRVVQENTPHESSAAAASPPPPRTLARAKAS